MCRTNGDMPEICARVSRAAMGIYSRVRISFQMTTYLQIDGQTKGSVLFFLKSLFMAWISGAVCEFRQGRASDMKGKCEESEQGSLWAGAVHVLDASVTVTVTLRLDFPLAIMAIMDELSRDTPSMSARPSINSLTG